MLLCYDVKKLKKYEQPLSAQNLHQSGPQNPAYTYYIYTGNTSWGVQNLCYDSHTGNMLAAVYTGKKPDWKNFGLFVVDGQQKPVKEVLRGVEPKTSGLVMPLLQQGEQDTKHGTWGWNFKWGNTGLTSGRRTLLRLDGRTRQGHRTTVLRSQTVPLGRSQRTGAHRTIAQQLRPVHWLEIVGQRFSESRLPPWLCLGCRLGSGGQRLYGSGQPLWIRPGGAMEVMEQSGRGRKQTGPEVCLRVILQQKNMFD